MNFRRKIIGIFIIALVGSAVIYSYSDIAFTFYLNRAIYYSDNDDYSNSLEMYDKLINQQPELYELHFNKGVVLAKMGKSQDAIKELEYALSLKDDDSELYYNLSLLYEDIDNDKATQYYNKAKELGINVEE